MRSWLILLLTVSVGSAQNIATKVLTPGRPMRIELSPEIATTLLFPSPISGTFGLGLVSAQGTGTGFVQLDHPEGSNVLVLHALTETAHVLATVLLDGVLYVFELQSGSHPDVALTLLKTNPEASGMKEVTRQEIVNARPKYDPELLVGFERRAHDAPALRGKYPDLYVGYSSRHADYTSDSGTVKTTVTTIHRFSIEDAIVLEGSVENETTHPIQFDGRATTVQVANEVHPAKLTDCLRPIPASATVPIVVVLQGDIDSSRANLSIDNEFRIMLPGDTGTVWTFKNGTVPKAPFKVPAPVNQAIPLTQTGSPVKETK